jgi:hypothetical protein
VAVKISACIAVPEEIEVKDHITSISTGTFKIESRLDAVVNTLATDIGTATPVPLTGFTRRLTEGVLSHSLEELTV